MSKRQEVPVGSVWQLRGQTSGAVLHDDVSATEAPHLLQGATAVPLADVPVGGSTTVELVGVCPIVFDLVRKA